MLVIATYPCAPRKQTFLVHHPAQGLAEQVQELLKRVVIAFRLVVVQGYEGVVQSVGQNKTPRMRRYTA